MERFTKAARILLDREFLSVRNELRALKESTMTPRVRYENKTH